MRRLPRGCEVIPLDEAAAHAAGALLGKTRTRDGVDASVAELSLGKQIDIVSDDAADIRRLLARGNLFSNGGNCATAATALSFSSTACGGNRDLGLAAQKGTTMGNDIDVTKCTHP